jgi:AbrB family looped-hinge helix DNA binding protein
MKWETDSKLHSQDKMYGTTTIGTKGQVVIPADARKDLDLKPGDQLLVMGKFGKVLGLIKADQMGHLIELIMQSIPKDKKRLKLHIQKHLEEVFNKK